MFPCRAVYIALNGFSPQYVLFDILKSYRSPRPLRRLGNGLHPVALKFGEAAFIFMLQGVAKAPTYAQNRLKSVAFNE